MKHIYIALLITHCYIGSFAQSQRIVLVEEFTGEDCGPCAGINPTFNKMLNDNIAKAVSLKYQGIVNPSNRNVLYDQTKAEVNIRDNYYSNTSLPTGVVDGNFKKANAGQIKTVDIDTRYADNSAFNLTVNHEFSAKGDSVFISVDMEATDNYSAGGNSTFKLRVALVEKEIELTLPALNGEKKFYNVMRKMYPNAAGTSLTQTWTIGQMQTVTFKAKLPSYIYDKSTIQVVAFLQDDNSKEVQQSAISQLKSVRLDSKVKVFNSGFMQCVSGGFEPKITMQNVGTDTLYMADIVVKVDNVAMPAYSWYGQLAKNATEEVTLPTVNVNTAGAHKIQIYTVSPNAEVDQNSYNDTLNTEFSMASAPEFAPYIQDFEAGLPSNFSIENPSGTVAWVTSNYSAFGQGSKSAYMRFFSNQIGEIDYLYLPTLDLTVATYARVTFDFSHVLYGTGYKDQCDVEGSYDCGKTWITLWSKSGVDLATKTGAVTAEFKPTASDWKSDFASLDIFAGKSNVLVRLKSKSDYGNNLYIDNLNVEITATENGGPTDPNSIEDVLNQLSFALYPNPVNDVVKVVFADIYESSKVTIADARGVVCTTKNVSNSNEVRIETHSLSNGVYFVFVESNGNIARKTFVVAH